MESIDLHCNKIHGVAALALLLRVFTHGKRWLFTYQNGLFFIRGSWMYQPHFSLFPQARAANVWSLVFLYRVQTIDIEYIDHASDQKS